MSFIEREKNGLMWLESTLIQAKHCFSSRLGGVSSGYLESLNLGVNRGDAPENVLENYRRLGAALGIDLTRPVVTHQVHKAEVRVASEPDRRGLYEPGDWEADGLVTSIRGLPIIIYIADCVPMLLCDAENGVVGAVHCGWRSSVADILGNAVGKMAELGARPENICAAAGPSIGPCCFETGPEVPEAIDRYLGGDSAGLYRPEDGVAGKYMVSLAEANRRRLIQLGLRPENVEVCPVCTKCDSARFWSHRATNGRRGSQCAVIVL